LPNSQYLIDYLDEFRKYVNEEYKECQSFFEILIDIMDDRVRNEHLSIKEAMIQFTNNNHYQNKDMNLAILEELGAIEPSTYTRIKNPDYTIKLQTAISICIVLCLDVSTSERLLNSAGYTLTKKSRLYQAYSFIIKMNYDEFMKRLKGRLHCYMRLEEANNILKELHIEEKYHLTIHV